MYTSYNYNDLPSNPDDLPRIDTFGPYTLVDDPLYRAALAHHRESEREIDVFLLENEERFADEERMKRNRMKKLRKQEKVKSIQRSAQKRREKIKIYSLF